MVAFVSKPVEPPNFLHSRHAVGHDAAGFMSNKQLANLIVCFCESLADHMHSTKRATSYSISLSTAGFVAVCVIRQHLPQNYHNFGKLHNSSCVK